MTRFGFIVAAVAPSNSATAATMKPNLVMNPLPKSGGFNSNSGGFRNGRCDHAFAGSYLLQRVRKTDSALESPNTTIAVPTRANSVHAGAPDAASHQPPNATSTRRMVPASTGPPTFAAPCEEK